MSTHVLKLPVSWLRSHDLRHTAVVVASGCVEPLMISRAHSLYLLDIRRLRARPPNAEDVFGEAMDRVFQATNAEGGHASPPSAAP